MAVATPKHYGAIAMVRISGGGCFKLIAPCLRFKSSISLAQICEQPQRIFRCEIVDPNPIPPVTIDDGTIIIYRAPASYTGEDAIELFVHGGLYIVDRIMAVLLTAGFQIAAPGEFTQRAFLNGKLDLSQAEGIRELTEATSHSQWQVARSLSCGDLRQHIATLRAKIITTSAMVEATMDFPDEHDTASLNRTVLKPKLVEIHQDLSHLAVTYRSGSIARTGMRVVLCGRANAGKSSLMNALSQTQRAIVTPNPGTTRDYLEATLLVDGVKITLIDTAGLRDLSTTATSPSPPLPLAEQLAIQTSMSLACAADLILHIQPSIDPTPLDLSALLTTHLAQTHSPPSTLPDLPEIIRVRSFADLQQQPTWQHADDLIISLAPEGKPQGLELLKSRLHHHAHQCTSELQGTAFICTPRQKVAVDQALQCMDQALAHLQHEFYEELVAQDLMNTTAALASIIGEVSHDDLLDQVFSQFCIGK